MLYVIYIHFLIRSKLWLAAHEMQRMCVCVGHTYSRSFISRVVDSCEQCAVEMFLTAYSKRPCFKLQWLFWGIAHV